MAIFDEKLDATIRNDIIKKVLDEWMRQNAGRVTSQIYTEIFNKLSANIEFGALRQRIQGQRFRFTKLIQQINTEINQIIQAEISQKQVFGAYATEQQRMDRLFGYTSPFENVTFKDIPSQQPSTAFPGWPPSKEAERERLRQERIRARQEEEAFNRRMAAERAADEAWERTQSLKQILPGGMGTYSRLSRMAQRRGFDPYEDLTSITRHEPLGVTDVLFSKDVEGVTQKMRVTVNKFGEVLVHTQRRMQDFFTAVGKDVVEFAKWSLAVALVLGPITKLNELIQLSIQNQTKLTNVLIALGGAQKSVNQIFEAAYDVSKQTGEAISGVIDAYTLAYRATGGTVQETERFTVAGKLLSDALTLSKLSTLDQAEAIDILSAALKQSEGELSSFGSKNESVLTKGSILLDKWVKTTKVANVSLDALATSFSIVGDAAEAAGLGVDELNGVIAVLGEVTGDVSGKEIGNMARALVSGFQSDKAAKQLQSLGIAIQDTTGEARNFMEVYGEISQLRIAGIISDEQLNKITLAIGGGTRRQAIVQAFIEQFGRIQQVSQESMGASGDAAQALAMQLDTVETASTRLANAFAQLAQTLGTKGGLLDFFTSVLNVATKLVEVFTTLTGLMGRTAPLLALTLGASAYLSYGQGLRKYAAASGVGKAVSGLVGGITRPFQRNQPMGIEFDEITGEPLRSRGTSLLATRAGLWAEKNAGGIAAAGVTLASAISNVLDESATKTERWARAGANVAGGLIGILKGNPVWAIVGSSIAESLLNATVLREGEWEDFWKDVFPKEKPSETAPEEEKRAYFSEKTIWELLAKSGKLTETENGMFRAFGLEKTPFGAERISELWASLINLSKGSQITPEQFAMGVLAGDPQFQAELNKLLEAEKTEKGVLPAEFTRKVADIIIPPGLVRSFQEELRVELLKREITPTQYAKTTELISGFGVRGAQYYAGFGEEYGKITGKPQEEVLRDFLQLTTQLTEEELNYITQLNAEIAKLFVQAQAAGKGTAGYNATMGEYNAKVREAAEVTKEYLDSILARKPLPEMANLEDYTTNIVNQVVALAQRLQEEEFKGLGLSEEEITAKKEAAEPFYIKTAEGYLKVDAQITDTRYIEEAVKRGAEEGIISGMKEFDFQQLSVPKELYDQLAPAYDQIKEGLEGVGYKIEEGNNELIIDSNGKAFMDNKNQKIMQFLLSQILTVEEKQLEGFYNFPEGVTPYVPFSAVSELSEFARANSGMGGTSINWEAIERLIASIGALDQTMQKVIPPAQTGTGEEKIKEIEIPEKVEAMTPDYIRNILESSFSVYGGKVPKYEGPTDWVERMMMGGQAKRYTPPFKGEYYPYEVPPFPSPLTPISYGQPSAVDTFKTALSNLSTKLALTINDRITVVMDGRIVATVIKSYLKQDLLKYAGSTSSAKTYTI